MSGPPPASDFEALERSGDDRVSHRQNSELPGVENCATTIRIVLGRVRCLGRDALGEQMFPVHLERLDAAPSACSVSGGEPCHGQPCPFIRFR
ncbi:hypothetical protein EMEDMD4_500010 [Sinorhizobium medicae]|uniref:Uncharacterized protein n=1 Tax=Sinorhizobium medicae TaxID=110321 RepID=A0A508X136_9HYPH|nr:hypothetical protein EMEDMD4_500010 [Sinorhizobium medicae]